MSYGPIVKIGKGLIINLFKRNPAQSIIAIFTGEQMKVDTTTNRVVTTDYIEFKCPNCGKSRIVRSLHARATAKTYKCEECGFIGP